MKPASATRRMRAQPNLQQLKRQAKELLRRFVAGDPQATVEVHSHYRSADISKFTLHDAQLVIARSYGFDSWPQLKAYVDGVTIKRLAAAISADDLAGVQAMLNARPELVGMAMAYGDEHRPIHYAVMNRLPDMVRLLMRSGADARKGIYPHRDATSALTIAKERSYQEIVAIIEEEEQRRPKRSAASAPETIGDEAARAAVAAGDQQWLQTRQAEGPLSNPIRWHDGGLLTVAVRHDQPEMLRLLLDSGLDPDEHISSGQGDWAAQSQGYPLWHCAALGRYEMAELLLQRGADPNVHVDSSGSAVHSAYSHQQWKMVELLRSHGGLVSADTAAIYRQTHLAEQMLAAEARGELPEGIVSPGKSLAEDLLHFGASGGDPAIVRMALARIDWPRNDSRWFQPLIEPLYFWHHIPWLYAGNREFDRTTYLACFRLILERCDANLTGSFGRTALHEVAAMAEHVTGEEATAFAAALLAAGAEANRRDGILKSTPLGWACRWGRVTVAALLLESGADPAEADAEPWARPAAWVEKMGHRAAFGHVLNSERS